MNLTNIVQVFTSLPPSIQKVDPFFYLHLHINYIKFTIKTNVNFENIDARVIWWGEEGRGSVFSPRCVNLAGYKQSVKTHGIYKVCVPMHHFTTYLCDMDKLYIDVIDKTKQSVIGRAFVDDMKQLGNNKTIRSLCNIYNEAQIKIGELMIVMAIEQAITSVNASAPKSDKVMSSKIDEIGAKVKDRTNITLKLKKSSNSLDNVDQSHDLIDDLIEKGKRLRETIAINVKDDEINEEIARRTFPNLDHDNDAQWLMGVIADQSVNNISYNDISKINTESILKSSPIIERKRLTKKRDSCGLNNDTEALKLLTVSDSYSGDSDFDDGRFKCMTRSEEDIAAIERQLSSDDDPAKHDSIIEELFYKRQMSDSDVGCEFPIKKTMKGKTGADSNNNKFNSVKSDFEIYKSLNRDRNDERMIGSRPENDYEAHHDELDDNPNDHSGYEPVDKNWYQNISAIKIYLDMLWLNPFNQSPNKSNRSRSQSPNCSSDRERCRRSHDSASSFNNSSISTSASKPPLSRSLQWNPSCKYFIEYKFPTSLTPEGDQEKENLSTPQCPVRVVVRNVEANGNTNNNSTGVRVFELNYTSDFPVSFNNATIGKWWKGVVRFRLICQDTNNKESVVGVSILPLRNVISTNNFYRLIPMRLPRNKLNKARVVIGSLAVRTSMVISATDQGYHQLSGHHFKGAHPQSGVIENPRQRQYQVPRSVSLVHRNVTQRPAPYRQEKSAPLHHTTGHAPSDTRMHPISLVSLLSVSRVRYINTKMSSGDYKSGIRSYNLYFIGRLLWAPDHKIKSRILWGSSKISDSESSVDLENFKLTEKVPLILTPDLMSKLKNNFAILEVWDKSMDNVKDSLYGLVKIPMNMLCLSFTNSHIRRTVLNNVYPVMCCDDWINVEDPLTGKSKGQIHVMLALGSHQQIENLQLSKENTADGHWNRNYMATTVAHGDLVEHSIDIAVESLRNVDMSPLADLSREPSFFYVQYYFPQQESITECNGRTWKSTTFRSVSHPGQANLDISDTNRHRFRLPIDSSLKGVLNNHFEAIGKKYILFELYTKQYNPFPSSRSIGKGRLQIASLFQLINQHSVSVDSMADTLTQQQIPIRLARSQDSEDTDAMGTLNLCVCYKTKLLENTTKNLSSANPASPFDQPIVKIEVTSATGLQSAAEKLVAIHPELEYASVTGVNSHVKYWLTDEANKQSRINVNSKGFQKFKIHKSKTVARSFVPKYDSINEILLGPIIDDTDTNTLCRTLAEKILTGVYQLNLEVYHDVPKSIYCDFEDMSTASSILIGKGRISIGDLLLRSAGVLGPIWMTLFSPMDVDPSFSGCKLNIMGKKKLETLYSIEKRKSVAAVEIRLGFNEKSDRRNILQLAMDIGYVIPWTSRLETEDLIWQSMDVHGCSFKYITVTIEEVELSAKLVNCVFTAEAGFKRSSMKIVTRYRIYKQSIASSPYFMLNEEELMERMFLAINHMQQYCYRVSSDLFRYLRESKLEVQVWAIYGSSPPSRYEQDYEQPDNPNDVRLLGSALFDLSHLILPSDSTHKTVSHILPLWKRGVANCDNANVTVTVDICGATSPLPNYASDNEDNEYGSKFNKGHNGDSNRKTVASTHSDLQKSFPAHIIVEKAVNLNTSISRNEKPLHYFVTFPCYEEAKILQSSIIKGSKDISWNFECDARLAYSLLTGKEATLDFKLYYSSTESESVEEISDEKVLVGIVKLDLSLLLKGFERVIGWYNVFDMQGICQGQMKIGVTPLVPLVANTAAVTRPSLPNSEKKPLTLEEHRDYLSSVRLRLRGDANPLPTFSSSMPYNGDHMQSSQDPEGQDMLSKSILYDTLKEKLRELDDINEGFRRKIRRDEYVECRRDDNNNAAEMSPLEVNESARSVDGQVLLSNDDVRDQCVGVDKTSFLENAYEHDFDYEAHESGSDFSEDPQEKVKSSESFCLNDPDNARHTTIGEMNSHGNSDARQTSDKAADPQRSEYESESECSSVSSAEIDVIKPTMSGRSSSLSGQRKYDEAEIDEIIHASSEYRPVRSPVNSDLNDSWESTDFHHKPDVSHELLVEAPVSDLLQSRTVIPRFFPPSVDFQEKMKALKRNIELNSNSEDVGRAPARSMSQSGKKAPLTKISDTEAQRLSRIFGVKRP